MAINFEALTILGGEFLEFEELPEAHIEIVVDENNFLGGVHLESQGDGESFWANYDSDEYFLRFEQIIRMKEGEIFSVSHNNWYGREDDIKILAKDSTETYFMWTRSFDKTYGPCGEAWEEKKFFLINYPKGLIEKSFALYNFRKLIFELEEMTWEERFKKASIDFEKEEFLDEMEEIEIIEEKMYEFPPCENSYCLGCGDEKCPFQREYKNWDKPEEKKPYVCNYVTCYGCGKCEY